MRNLENQVSTTIKNNFIILVVSYLIIQTFNIRSFGTLQEEYCLCKSN